MTREIVATDNAPGAIGPYSQAIVIDNLVFASGQIALIPGTKDLNNADIRTETRQVLTNLQHVVEAAGSSFANAVKLTVFMTDMNDYGAINEIYAEFLGDSKPARAAVEVSKLPAGANVEIEGIFAKTN